ncbi:MAG: hypothetical protein GXP11_07360 [Gammaproteobacteria bacterium]|nr:hypothetical protein [Gammaproteobacteria bacterium]
MLTSVCLNSFGSVISLCKTYTKSAYPQICVCLITAVIYIYNIKDLYEA